MSFSKNEVLLLPIPFTDLTSRKVRPAVVIGHSSRAGDLFVVPISSQLPNADLVLQDWRAAGLNVLCGIKSQIATIEEMLNAYNDAHPERQFALASLPPYDELRSKGIGAFLRAAP